MVDLESAARGNATHGISEWPSRTPSVAVIVACKNAAPTIAECLHSVVNQDYPHKELLVVDGASSDGTTNIIDHFGDEIIYADSVPDRSVYEAWNRALRHVTSQWVLLLGADDRLVSPHTLTLVAQRLGQLPATVRVAYGSQQWFSGTEVYPERWGSDWGTLGRRWRLEMPLPHQATFHRMSLFNEYGRFDSSYRIAGDYEFFLRMLPRERPQFLPGIVVTLKGRGGLSDDRKVRNLKRLERARAQATHGMAWAVPVSIAVDAARQVRNAMFRVR